MRNISNVVTFRPDETDKATLSELMHKFGLATPSQAIRFILRNWNKKNQPAPPDAPKSS
jgi:hypothetical protein